MMTRFLLIPVLAMAAWAQPRAQTEAAEAALRRRVQQFYQLQLDKKFRDAEKMVADDTKDDYYNSRKPNFKGFEIEKLEVLNDNTQGKVMVNLKVLVLMPGAGAQVFDMRTPTYWKVEDNEWRWYIPAEVKTATPFGKMRTGEAAQSGIDMKGAAPGGIENPNMGVIMGQVQLDRTLVELSEKDPDGVVVITNGLPGPTDLRVDPHVAMIKGLSVKVDKLHLDKGEKTEVHFHLTGKEKVSDIVEIVASPLNRPLDIGVRSK